MDIEEEEQKKDESKTRSKIITIFDEYHSLCGGGGTRRSIGNMFAGEDLTK